MENRNKGRLGELVQLFENRRKNDMESGECFIKLSFPFVDEILLPILKAALPEEAHLLTLEEAEYATGVGILEEWFAEDKDCDGSIMKETMVAGPCAFHRGKVINENGDVLKLANKMFYNRKYGYRAWIGQPTNEQMASTPWYADPED